MTRSPWRRAQKPSTGKPITSEHGRVKPRGEFTPEQIAELEARGMPKKRKPRGIP